MTDWTAWSDNSSAPPRHCRLCYQPEHGSTACAAMRLLYLHIPPIQTRDDLLGPPSGESRGVEAE
jgi:hypothetical protein